MAAVVSVVGVAVGCAASGREPTHMPPPVAPPPAAPAARATPINADLAVSAQKELTAALKSSDPLMRMHALEVVRETAPDGQEQAALAALADRDAGVRFAAAMVCGERRIAGAKSRLLLLATDPSVNVQVAARFALHRLGDTRLSHDLEKTARDPSQFVRRDTALVLGLLDEKSALNILRPLRHDLDVGVRQQALESMWRLGDESALEEIVALTVSRYPDDQMFGLLALAAPRLQRVRGHVRAKLTADYPQIALVAARAMGMLGSDDGYTVAINGAKSKDPEERFHAARALGAIGRTDAQPTLGRLLEDGDPHVRLVAAASLLQLGRNSAQASAR